MRYGNPDFLSALPRPGRGFVPAVATSAVLHAALLMFLLRTPLAVDLPEPAPMPSRIAVRLAPPPASRLPPPALDESLSAQEAPGVPVTGQGESPTTPADVAAERVSEAGESAVDVPADPDIASISPTPVRTGPQLPEQDAGIEGRADAPLPEGAAPDVDVLLSAISRYTTTLRGDLTGAWVEACTIARRNYNTKDCPDSVIPQPGAGLAAGLEAAAGAFAGITRPQRHRLLTERFLASTARLRPLLGEEGPLGEQARIRFHLDREYLEYLNGNYDYMIWMHVQAAQSNNPNLPYLRRQYQFLCREMPCIYEYTGFGTERESPAESDGPPGFRITPSLFGTGRP